MCKCSSLLRFPSTLDLNHLVTFMERYGCEILHHVREEDLEAFLNMYRHHIVPFSPQLCSALTRSQAPEGAVFGFRKAHSQIGHWDGACVFIVNTRSKRYMSAIFEDGKDYVCKWRSTSELHANIDTLQAMEFNEPMSFADLSMTSGV